MNKIVLQNNNGVPVVSSREIAQRFGKEHKDVVIRIEGKVRSDGSKESGLIEGIMERGFPPAKYFIESLYLNKGKQYREYLMTRNGFSLLVMGFTGV